MSHERARLEEVHATLLEQWRSRMNLVGPGPVSVHFDDARAALDGQALSGAWVDLGSGAGFPGLVFAAHAPGATFDLVDSRRKRCVFLEEVVRRAGATGIRVHCMRLEGLDARYDGVTARALASPEQMIEHARGLLKPAGTLILFLQGDADVPVADDFDLVRDVRYEAGGRGRRAAWLRAR